MSLPAALLVVVAAFVLMEPVTALTHRFVMHGIGRRLHRSHHQPDGSRFELNDWFPVMFASIVMLGLWAGFNLDGLEILIPVGIGVTLYGAAYALVHDVYIHGRVGWFAERSVWRTGRRARSPGGRPPHPSRAQRGAVRHVVAGRSARASRSPGGLQQCPC